MTLYPVRRAHWVDETRGAPVLTPPPYIPAISVGPTPLAFPKGPPLSQSARRFQKVTPPPVDPQQLFIERLVRGLFHKPDGDSYLQMEGVITLPLRIETTAGTSTARAEIVVGEGGRIEKLKVTLSPPAGPILAPRLLIPFWPEWLPCYRVPILAPFCRLDGEGVRMNPTDRTLEATGRFFGRSVTMEMSDTLFSMAGIEEDYFQQNGLAENRVPLTADRIVGMVMHLLSRKVELAESLPLRVTPLWEQGSLDFTGDFSSRALEFNLETDPTISAAKTRKIRMVFGDIPNTAERRQPHRLEIKGPLTNPTFSVLGLEAVEYLLPDRMLRVTNRVPPGIPLSLETMIDLIGETPAVTLNWSQDYGMTVTEYSRAGGEAISTLDLPHGGRIDQFKVALRGSTPVITIARVETKALHFLGYGVDLHIQPTVEQAPEGRTPKPVKAVISDIRLQMGREDPLLSGTVLGRAEGTFSYLEQGVKQGEVEFRPMSGYGQFAVYPNSKAPEATRVEIKSAHVFAQLPRLKLRVRSGLFFGHVVTDMRQVTIQGKGELTLFPARKTLTLSDGSGGFRFRAERAEVDFYQKTYRFSSVLGKYFPQDLLGRFMTSVHLSAPGSATEPGLEFTAQQMNLAPAGLEDETGHRPQDETGIFEMTEVELREIRIPHGEMTGWLVGFDTLSPLRFISRVQQMKIAAAIQSLSDHTSTQGNRHVEFNGLQFFGEEGGPTLSAADQRRCGFDRQKVAIDVDRFAFETETRLLEMRGVRQFFLQVFDKATGTCPRGGKLVAP